MKNLFKNLGIKGNENSDFSEYLKNALNPVLTAVGATDHTIAIMRCGESLENLWGAVIGINMNRLTNGERSRVRDLIAELEAINRGKSQ